MVNISTTQTLKGSKEGTPSDPAPKALRSRNSSTTSSTIRTARVVPRKVSSLGSGFVIDPSGLVVTNNHVIEGADEIIINFTDGTKLKVDEDSRARSQDRSRPPQGRAEGAAEGGALWRFVEDAGGRLGDGDRQPLRPRRQRHGRHHLRHQARHQFRPLRRFPANRRSHQPRQFGRAAFQHGRRSDRREHGHHLADRRLDRHRLCGALEQRLAGRRSA